MIKSKKQMFLVIGVFTLVMLLGTVTYAFFNYTRTGASNVIKTGRISFTSSQDGNINLTNVFPITSSEAETDTTNTDEVVITITGDTTYTGGIEYLVTLEDVKIETSTYKKIPVGLIVTPEVDDTELGTENTNYFNTGVRGGNTSYYKVLADDTVKDGEYVLVGYIRPGVAEVNGKIGIKAYLDKNKILISDTYDGTESDNMGTLNSMAEGKTVLTTNEWNSIQGNNAISFKVRVQANEGIWVGEPLSRNDMANFNTYKSELISTSIRSTITEINFIRMSEEMIDTHANLIDLTANGGQGVVKAWVDGTKLYIASPGETYFPVNSSSLFSNYSNVTKINFNNINTSNVTNMLAMFANCSSLTSIDISSFDTSSVENMQYMFGGCGGLTNIDFSYLDTSSVTNMMAMFQNCTNLISVNLSGLGSNSLSSIAGLFNGCQSLTAINMSSFNFGSVNSWSGTFSLSSVNTINLSNANTSNVTSMLAMFANCTSLTNLYLADIDTSKVTEMSGMFDGCTSLTTLDLSSFDTSNVEGMAYMFHNCTSLTTLDLSGFDTSSVTDMMSMFAMGTKSENTWTPSNNNLTTIKVGSGWNTSSVTYSNDMFYNNTHLVGGAGTVYDGNYIDKTYARIDGGTSNPGYLTLKTN